ncbi:MAG: adenylate/guanylate cyclase domain-containing protein [Phormidesmis sp.]
MNTHPVHPQIQRTLAAIVVTDAVGFSKRMSQDEDRALAVINRDLQLIGELCEFFEGQILKTVGDGVLMYFVSAVQAAACALEVQKTFASFAQKNKKSGITNEHFTHRVGVHLGDIFFNQQDMMGTGVNIAARLESEAHPGGICMSKVVYDVVKSRLDLDADYIGELLLKNIEEAVAAYHVWPLGMRPEKSKEDTTEAVAPLTITPLNAAFKALSEHPNSARIKKLLYGTHQSCWENDTAVLEVASLKALLESLTNRNASINECRNSLYQIVGTLNRKEEYTQVAEVILENLTAFYVEVTAGSVIEPRPLIDPPCMEDPTAVLYEDIASRLDITYERVRMKKMLYCLCYDRWENDSDRITQIPTITLIEELYKQISTIQGLQNRLRAILLRLNRKAKYAPIANFIFQECQILYPEGNSQISMPGTVDLEDSTCDNTQINLRKKPAKRWTAAKQAASNPPRVTPVLVPSAAFGN